MPKVLICAYACVRDPSTNLPGGGDLMAWNVIRELRQRHELWVLTAAQNRPAIEAKLEKEPMPGVHFAYVGLPDWLYGLNRVQGGIQFYAYLWQWQSWFAARRLHRKIHFDLFHHLTYENDWMASITGALLPVPYVRGPGGGAHRVPAKFRREFALGPRLWEYVRMGMQWVFRHDPFFALGQRRARALLMANREAFDALPRRWQKKAQLLSVNGVSLDGFQRAAATRPQEGRFRLLTAGRLIPLKGFDLVISAFRLFVERVRREQPEIRLELTVVGDGPEGPRLQQQIDRLGLGGRVRLVKWMPREELFREMAEADAFVFASLRDGGGLVVVEAMAAGKPVVCFDLAGPGLHVNGDCGIKVAARSPEQAVEDLAAAFRRLALDAELRDSMGRAARRRAEQVYDWSRVADRIESVYLEALGQGSRRDEGHEPEGVRESRESRRVMQEQVPAEQ